MRYTVGVLLIAALLSATACSKKQEAATATPAANAELAADTTANAAQDAANATAEAAHGAGDTAKRAPNKTAH